MIVAQHDWDAVFFIESADRIPEFGICLILHCRFFGMFNLAAQVKQTLQNLL